MTALRFLLTPYAMAVAAAAMPAQAASTAASSASSASSASIGSLSDSIRNSSDASSRPARTAQGDYQVTAVAVVDGKPGMLRVTLAAADGDDGEGFDLLLPQKAADAGGVAVGQVVHAAPRPYGVEFARADNREAFFLVLQDEWYRELASNPV
jgi:hypothetical protein